MYCIYILKCRNGELYTGITSNPERRFSEHFSKSKGSAKYTKSHPPTSIAAIWQTIEKGDALSLEFRIKALSKRDKEYLIANPREIDSFLFGKYKEKRGKYTVYPSEKTEMLRKKYCAEKYRFKYPSPLGDIICVSDGEKLCALYFEQDAKSGARESNFEESADIPIFEECKRWLDTYFDGRVPDFTPKIEFSGTEFQKRVWEILLTIPYGETLTYGEIAKRISGESGKAMSAQAVGGAVGKNPISIIVPCHRVIGKGGALVGYAGGLWRKEYMIELERKARGRA